MNMEQLKYLVAIAENGSINKASKQLLLTPQLLSHSIIALEKEIGIKLFIRLSTGVLPTPEGNLIIEMARKMLATYNETMDILNTSGKKSPATIHLYAHNVYTEAFLNHIVMEYMNKEKNIFIEIHEFSNTALEQVKRKEAQGIHDWVVFTHFSKKEKLPAVKYLFNFKKFTMDEDIASRYMLCVAKDNILEKQKSISMKMLSELPLVRFNSDSDNVEKELDYFDFYFRGHPFQTAYKINNLAGWIAAIKNGKGVGLIDSIVTGARSKCKTWFEDIAILPVTDSVEIQHNFFASLDCPEEVEDFVEIALKRVCEKKSVNI